MKKDIYFWVTMLFRGFIALFAGSFVMVIPDMARTLLLLPLALVFSVLVLAAYGIIDSGLVLASSFMTESSTVRIALLSQGFVGMIIGTLFLGVVFDHVRLEWFLTLAGILALSSAVGESLVARHSSVHAVSIWNHAASGVAFCASIVYFVLRVSFASSLTSREVSWLVYVYLVVFGVAQCITAARMLYEDRRFVIE